jgi:glycosyltransferase involved in cell wall biosynthesis
MLGWEYPPHISGGLGIASQGLARALAQKHTVDFLLPRKRKDHEEAGLSLLDAETRFDSSEWLKTNEISRQLKFLDIGVELVPYLPPKYFQRERTEEVLETTVTETDESMLIKAIKLTGTYHDHLPAELKKYALIAAQQATSDRYDVVHAHDWMTFQAAIAAKKATGIPFVAHVHSTEYDRNGDYGDPAIFKWEAEGLKEADRVIAVSSRVKTVLTDRYRIAAEKIDVIFNGFDPASYTKDRASYSSSQIVGFAGRFVHQKGVLQFIDIAREISNKKGDVHFVMAGDGYLMEEVKQKIERFNLTKKVTITGFLTYEKMQRTLRHFNVLVLPSVSEPFGLAALEAVHHKIPVVTSEASGLAEFIPSLPTAPQWDIFSFTSKVMALLGDKDTAQKTADACFKEAKNLTWKKSADLTDGVYQSLI